MIGRPRPGRLLGNTAASAADYALLVVLNLAATPVLIANFGVAGYGAFVFLSVFSLSGALSFLDLGMEGSLATRIARYEAAGDRTRLHRCLVAGVTYYVLLGIVVATVLTYAAEPIAARFIAGGADMDRGGLVRALRLIAAMVLVQFLTLPFDAVLQGLRRIKLSRVVSSSANLLQYSLVMLAAIRYGRVDAAFAAILVLTILRFLAVLGIFRLAIEEFRGLRLRFDGRVFRELFEFSSVLFVSRLVGLIFNQVDKVLIWRFLPISSLAIYSVVTRPGNLLRLILTVLNSSVAPEVARWHRLGDLAAVRRLYLRLVHVAYLLILPPCLAAGVHIETLITLWVGPEFAPHAPLALILLAVYLLAPIPSVASPFVLGMERVAQTLWISVVASLINLTLSLAWVGPWGIAGLLAASLMSETFMVIPYVRLMSRALRLAPAALFGPVGNSVRNAVPFLLAQLAARWIFADSPRWELAAASAIAAGHLVWEYMFLLSPAERTRLTSMFGAAGRAAPRSG